MRDLARKVGGVEKLFSKRAMKYRAMGLHERELSEDEMARLMAEEYTFVTRPVIVRGDRATAGFSAKRVDELVGVTEWARAQCDRIVMTVPRRSLRFPQSCCSVFLVRRRHLANIAAARRGCRIAAAFFIHSRNARRQ